MRAAGIRRGRRRSDRPPVHVLVTGALLLDALFAIGAVAVWPIYRSAAFVVLVAVALLLAHAIALIGTLRRWSGWRVAAVTAATYVVVGLPLAVPSAMTGWDAAVQGLLAVITAPVSGWKDLLTLELPLGSYQATLAPALLLFLAVPVLSLSLAWRSRRLWVFAAPAALALTVFGVLFGPTVLSPSGRVGELAVPGPVEIAIGVGAILAALGFVVWRTLYERRRTVQAAEVASGVYTTGRTSTALAGRIAVGATMVVAAVGIGAVLAPLAVAGQPRDVLRASIDPRLEIASTLSPLVGYRAYLSDSMYDEVLFTVDAPGADRVRIATLAFFDGRVAQVIDPAGGLADESTAFVRVPSALAPPEATTPTTARIEIGAYDDVWVPLVGALTSLRFTQPPDASIADGFFYNAATRTGVELSDPGLAPGASYVQSAALDSDLPLLATVTPGRDAPAWDESVVPASLVDWIRAQDAPGGGEGLAVLIDRLRARGYLSHALSADAAVPPQWLAALGGSAFQPSRAGHSTDRIDDLFTALLTRQNDVGGTDDASLVAAVGDDEQFAVAAAMIADQLGFEVRIVLGARLSEDDSDPAAIPACEAGTCRGANMSAWIEVQDASGAWLPVDVTPQHETSPSPDLDQRRDPQIPTEVLPQHAESVLPAEANPADSSDRDDDDTPPPADLSALWTALRVSGIALLVALVLAGPLLLVVALKFWRRRSRRRATDPADRMTGGWDEFVDAAVDNGHASPRTQTRQELAIDYSGAHGAGPTLATWADRAVFDSRPPSEAEADEFWRIVDAERERFAAEGSRWTRLRARLSLRSLVRAGDRRGPRDSRAARDRR